MTQIDSEVIVDFRMARLQRDQILTFPKLGIGNPVGYVTLGSEKPRFLSCDCAACRQDGSYAVEFNGSENVPRFLDANQDLLRSRPEIDRNDHELIMLLPTRAFAFILRKRKWATIDIRRLNNVQDVKGLDSLVLPSSHREVLQALVQTHFSSSRLRQTSVSEQDLELVRGKGQGLVVLLHGAPGKCSRRFLWIVW